MVRFEEIRGNNIPFTVIVNALRSVLIHKVITLEYHSKESSPLAYQI